MSETRSLRQQAREELRSETCVCGRKKAYGHSFCGGCYHALPAGKQRALYTTFADGYAEIYDEAKELLKAEGRIR